MLRTLQGVYRNGQIELDEAPDGVRNDTTVIVTFLESGLADLASYNINREEAAALRERLTPFAEEWDSPEMDIYNNNDRTTDEL